MNWCESDMAESVLNVFVFCSLLFESIAESAHQVGTKQTDSTPIREDIIE